MPSSVVVFIGLINGRTDRVAHGAAPQHPAGGARGAAAPSAHLRAINAVIARDAFIRLAFVYKLVEAVRVIAQSRL